MALPRFKSKIDTWVGVLMCVPPVASVATGIPILMQGHVLEGLLPMAAIALLYVGLVLPIYYELDADALVVRFGLVRVRIPYAAIKSVEPTTSPISSPALSLDRLRIERTGSVGVNISPADRAGFLTALSRHAPHLRLDGETLRPR